MACVAAGSCGDAASCSFLPSPVFSTGFSFSALFAVPPLPDFDVTPVFRCEPDAFAGTASAFAVAFELSLSDAPSFFADPSRPNAASEITPTSSAHTTSPIIHPSDHFTPLWAKFIRRSASRLLPISRSIHDVFWGFERGLLMTQGLPRGTILSTDFAAGWARTQYRSAGINAAALHSNSFSAISPWHRKFE